jgi:hypothetical protein
MSANISIMNAKELDQFVNASQRELARIQQCIEGNNASIASMLEANTRCDQAKQELTVKLGQASELLTLRLTVASIKIQKVVRGFKVRKTERMATVASIKIQTMFRGYMGRKARMYEEMRIAEERNEEEERYREMERQMAMESDASPLGEVTEDPVEESHEVSDAVAVDDSFAGLGFTSLEQDPVVASVSTPRQGGKVDPVIRVVLHIETFGKNKFDQIRKYLKALRNALVTSGGRSFMQVAHDVVMNRDELEITTTKKEQKTKLTNEEMMSIAEMVNGSQVAFLDRLMVRINGLKKAKDESGDSAKGEKRKASPKSASKTKGVDDDMTNESVDSTKGEKRKASPKSAPKAKVPKVKVDFDDLTYELEEFIGAFRNFDGDFLAFIDEDYDDSKTFLTGVKKFVDAAMNKDESEVDKITAENVFDLIRFTHEIREHYQAIDDFEYEDDLATITEFCKQLCEKFMLILKGLINDDDYVEAFGEPSE